MKKFFIFVALCFVALAGHAQTGTDMPMATLQSGDKVSVYYGKDAFKWAYDAAADSGDVITLSAGVFDVPSEIQKSLSIIGNGFVDDQENGKYPTYITGDINFSPRDILDDDGETISEAIGYDGTRLEGLSLKRIFFIGNRTVNNFSIVKCYFEKINLESNTKNFTIRQSIVGNLGFNLRSHLNFYIVGSWIEDYNSSYGPSDGMVTADHCIINGHWSSGTVSNSILKSASEGVVANNCIFMENTPTKIMGTGNWFDCKYAGIFEKELTDLEWNNEENHFALKYPSEYVGTDGTEVGLYGGPYPYNPTPTTPQITESNIDTTVAGDGVLKVSITVEAQTEN